ncbi:RNA-binding ATPase activator esf2 [Conoideocrella luteorostrata]|uniref:18S rRNA factor 2 n=1 Tax=Conoideocrella luteorostrata TaxID=1105319 RepID=A0AAJ0CF94_9HYPO|nr:RNA-binding ATPase activator esf2 [Conoideocrella luteorostrata]
MATGKKRNEFLDASESEDYQLDNYDSDNELTKGGRTAKRRKIASDDDASDIHGDASNNEGSVDGDGQGGVSSQDEKDGDSKPRKDGPKLDTSILDLNKPPAKKNLVVSDAAIKKSGVVYISRIPPGMKPSALRSLLSPYGRLNRTFLMEEDATVRARRRKAGGNKRVLFTEGWVEFTKKKDAKAACELLNGHNIGGKKRSFFRDDIWNLVYLKGFKWHNLTEQITAENAERASRMRAEIGKATKENKQFVRNVEKAKMLDGMQAKAKAKKRKAVDDDDDDDEKPAKRGRELSFRQVSQIRKNEGSQGQPEHVTRVLSKIF